MIARILEMLARGNLRSNQCLSRGVKLAWSFQERVREGLKRRGRSSPLYGKSPIKHDTAAVPFYLLFILYAGTSYGICDGRKRARQPNRLLVVIKDTSFYQRTIPSSSDFLFFFFLSLFGRVPPLFRILYLVDHRGALSGTRLCRIISRM